MRNAAFPEDLVRAFEQIEWRLDSVVGEDNADGTDGAWVDRDRTFLEI